MTEWAADNEWAAGEPETAVASSWGDGDGNGDAGATPTETATTAVDYGEGYEVTDAPPDEGKKPKRVGKKTLEQLQSDRQNGEETFVTIWHRAGKGKPLTIYMQKFPRGAAKAFSEVWERELDAAGSMAVLTIEDADLEPYKLILDWVDKCVDEGNDIKFPQIKNEGDAINVLIRIITAADKLKVPEMSLQAHLKKTAIKYARKSLIEIDNIERLYDEDAYQYLGSSEALQEAAAASIFEAWWTCKLDDTEYDDYCSYVEQMRVQYPKLDDDINKKFEDKKQWREQQLVERRAKREAAAAATVAAVSNDGFGDGLSATDGNVGWGTTVVGTSDGAGEWDSGQNDRTELGGASAASPLDAGGETVEWATDTAGW